jgi:hypothetical protein
VSIVYEDRPTGSSLGDLSGLGDGAGWLLDLAVDEPEVLELEDVGFDYGIFAESSKKSQVESLMRRASPTGSTIRLVNPALADALGRFDRAFAVPPDFASQLRVFRAALPGAEPGDDVEGAGPAQDVRTARTLRAAHEAARQAVETQLASNVGRIIGAHARTMRVFLSGSGTELLSQVLKTTIVGTVSGALVETFADQAAEESVGVRPRPVDDAVELIQRLTELLGVPLKDVLAAAGIRPRTYHSWRKPNAPKPRVGSQGHLWQLADSVADLSEHVGGDVRAWLHGRPERLRLLRAGELDELMSLRTAEQLEANQRARGRDYGVALAEYSVSRTEGLEPLVAGRHLAARRAPVTAERKPRKVGE